MDLDLKKLESQLLNKTSQFLELEKNFYKLQAQHERLLHESDGFSALVIFFSERSNKRACLL